MEGPEGREWGSKSGRSEGQEINLTHKSLFELGPTEQHGSPCCLLKLACVWMFGWVVAFSVCSRVYLE